MRKIGRYEIEKELGRGGMGVVFLARDPRVLRRVALKTYHVPAGLSRDEESEFRERFLREAQAAGALSHPAIVTVHDVGEDENGLPYIVMEWVQGRSLKEVLASEGRLDHDRALDMAMMLADALSTAHRAGVIHRDIKPANILVADGDGSFKLTDFGVAQTADSRLTRSGTTYGSPGYMSPEQISCREIDSRSDLFSLGTVLYEALCGEAPFDGTDMAALVYAIAHTTPLPLSKRVAGLPGGIDPFMTRALAKDPVRRFADGREFRSGLDAVRHGSRVDIREPGEPDPQKTTVRRESPVKAERDLPAVVRPARRERRFLRRPGVAAVLLLAATLVGWIGWSQAREATVIVEGSNTFEDAELTLTVDDEEVYARTLVAERKTARMFGKKLFDYGKEGFDTSFDLSPGRHEVQARVRAAQDGSEFEDRLTIKLEPGETMRLRLILKPATGVTLEPD